MNHSNIQDNVQKKARPVTPKVKELIANTQSIILVTSSFSLLALSHFLFPLLFPNFTQ